SLCLHDDRDGTVVEEVDLHPGTEDAARDGDPFRGEGLAEALVERDGLLGYSGAGEARTVALRGVRDQRQLAHDQPPAAGLEAAAEGVVRVVVHGRELEHNAELLLRLAVPADPEVRDPERLADRRLVRLAALRLLERHRRLRRATLPEMRPALLEELVDLAHN